MDTRTAIASYNATSEAEGWEQLCDPDLRFTLGDFAAVLSVWKCQAASGALPTRAAMSARVLKTFLPRIGLKERVATGPSRYRWRIVGTRVAEVLGERTGTFVDENTPPRQAARWIASCDLVLGTCAPLRFVGRVLAPDKDFMTSELLFMPLADEDGSPRFVMGFGHYNADINWRDRLQAAAPSLAPV
jgi:hypothetical protein